MVSDLIIKKDPLDLINLLPLSIISYIFVYYCDSIQKYCDLLENFPFAKSYLEHHYQSYLISLKSYFSVFQPEDELWNGFLARVPLKLELDRIIFAEMALEHICERLLNPLSERQIDRILMELIYYFQYSPHSNLTALLRLCDDSSLKLSNQVLKVLYFNFHDFKIQRFVLKLSESCINNKFKFFSDYSGIGNTGQHFGLSVLFSLFCARTQFYQFYDHLNLPNSALSLLTHRLSRRIRICKYLDVFLSIACYICPILTILSLNLNINMQLLLSLTCIFFCYNICFYWNILLFVDRIFFDFINSSEKLYSQGKSPY